MKKIIILAGAFFLGMSSIKAQVNKINISKHNSRNFSHNSTIFIHANNDVQFPYPKYEGIILSEGNVEVANFSREGIWLGKGVKLQGKLDVKGSIQASGNLYVGRTIESTKGNLRLSKGGVLTNGLSSFDGKSVFNAEAIFKKNNLFQGNTTFKSGVTFEGAVLRFSGGSKIAGYTYFHDPATFEKGVRTTDIVANKVTLKIGSFPDYVFANDYNLMPLKEVDAFIKKHQHLPNMKSEKEVVKEGMELKELTLKLVEKVEELTLYTIQQQKLIDNLQVKLNTLKK